MKKNNTTERTYRILKYVIWAIPVLIFAWVVERHIVISGHLEIQYPIPKGSPFVRNFASKEPDVIIGTTTKGTSEEHYQFITKNPLYFDVVVPRPFPKATVKITYKNPDQQPVLRIGAKSAGEAYYYQDLALINPILDGLPDHWDMIRDGDNVLWQRDAAFKMEKEKAQEVATARREKVDAWRASELDKLEQQATSGGNSEAQTDESVSAKKKAIESEYQAEVNTIEQEAVVVKPSRLRYRSISEFFAQPPDPQRVLQYNTDISGKFIYPHHVQQSVSTVITKSLRGSHEIYTYIGDGEELNFTFTFQDMNRERDADPVNVTLLDIAGEQLDKRTLPDDGDVSSGLRATPPRTVELSRSGLNRGVYRINIQTTDDVLITRIKSSQQLLTFHGSVFLAENKDYANALGDGPFTPTSLYTTSTQVEAITRHQTAFQDITVVSPGKRTSLQLTGVKEKISFDRLEGMSVVTATKNDVQIYGNAGFAFSQNQYFDPSEFSIRNLDSVKDVEQYDFIYAKYRVARQEGDWLVAEATLEAPQLYVDTGKDREIHFLVDMPGLGENNRILKIKELTVTLDKEPITVHNALQKVRNFFRRLTT